ncbi:unnamed protein product [Rhodiola kirilowii]
MNVMRRLKSIASGRSSFSDPLSGDSSTKRAKVDQEEERKASGEPHLAESSILETHNVHRGGRSCCKYFQHFFNC